MVRAKRSQMQKFVYHIIMVLIAVAFGLLIMQMYIAASGSNYYYVGLFTLRSSFALDSFANIHDSQNYNFHVKIDPGKKDENLKFSFLLKDKKLSVKELSSKTHLTRALFLAEDLKLPEKAINISNNDAVFYRLKEGEVLWNESLQDTTLLKKCSGEPLKTAPTIVSSSIGVQSENKEMVESLSTFFNRHNIGRATKVTDLDETKVVQLKVQGAPMILIVSVQNIYAKSDIAYSSIYVNNERAEELACRIQKGLSLAKFAGSTVLKTSSGYQQYRDLRLLLPSDIPIIYLNLYSNKYKDFKGSIISEVTKQLVKK
jgi:hypothetical protein